MAAKTLLEQIDSINKEREDALKALRASMDERRTVLQGELDQLDAAFEAAFGVKGKGRKGSGTRKARATPEQTKARKDAILSALKGTGKGKGMAAGAIKEKGGSALADVNLSIMLGTMRDEKLVKSEGKGPRGTTWYLA